VSAQTIVSFHAHPDDEALLTGGTLARAAAAGHRVVIVTATDGGSGLAATRVRSDGRLAVRRRAELERAAAALGAAEVHLLGYDDSGMAGTAGENGFARADVDSAAERLVEILRGEAATALTVYDRNGGYGHPDHVQVHRVGVRAAALAATPVVLEATLDRRLLTRALRLMRVTRVGVRIALPQMTEVYSAREDLTHRIDVRDHLAAKRAAMAMHASQLTSDDGDRTLALCLRLPPPLFRLAFGHEWFTQRGLRPGQRLLDDPLAVVGPPAGSSSAP
jgi:LmbE family N-acetylglucosaminyl deacetylase